MRIMLGLAPNTVETLDGCERPDRFCAEHIANFNAAMVQMNLHRF